MKVAEEVVVVFQGAIAVLKWMTDKAKIIISFGFSYHDRYVCHLNRK
jgi:hypothetical protein